MRRFAASAGGAYGEFEIIWYIDADDPDSLAMADELWRDGLRSYKIVHARYTHAMSDMWNVCAEQAHGEIMGMAADDLVFRNLGWDRIVAEAFERFPDRIAFVHGRDGLQDERLATHGFLHRRWVEAVGFTAGCFSCDYADAWIDSIARQLGRLCFVSELETEHMHPSAGKAPWDGFHRERMERGVRDKVWELWRDTEQERREKAEVLRGLML